MSREWTPVYAAISTASRVAALPDDSCRLFYTWLLLHADGYGCLPAKPAVIHARVWPIGHTLRDTERAIGELLAAGLLNRHERDGHEWFEVPDWDDKAGVHLGRGKGRGKRAFPDAPGSPPAPPQREEKGERVERQMSPRGSRAAPRGSRAEGQEQKPRAAPTGPQAEFIRAFEAEFLRTRGQPYVFGGAKDGAAAARIVKAVGLEKATRYAALFLSDSDPWIQGHPEIAVMAGRLNRYAPPADNTGASGYRRI